MSTRAELLEAIRAHPEEDTPRLMYADWLDDHGDCDRDTATAEFVRLSIGTAHKSGRRRDSMPNDAYRWLLGKPQEPHSAFGNFYRLIPKLLALHVASWHAIARRSGRWVEVQLHHDISTMAGWKKPVATHVLLEFRYGFVAHAWTRGNQPEKVIEGLFAAVAADQPNAGFGINDDWAGIREWTVDWCTLPWRVNLGHAAQTE